jgi:plasmid stability protein
MPSLQVKNVPEETLAVLRKRAAESHQSLQEYMLERLIAEARRPTWDEIWAELDRTPGSPVTYDDIREALDASRDAH